MTQCRTVRNRENPYLTVDKSILKEKGLSLEAKGLFIVCMSFPENWKYNLEHLTTVSTNGRTSVRNAINELVEFGYCEKRQLRGSGQRFTAFEYVFYESPKLKESLPQSGFPTAENPTSENRTLQSNESSSEEEDKSKEQQQHRKETVVVVVPSELKELELQVDVETKICKTYSKEEIKLAVERLHKWPDRESNVKAITWLLKYPDKWQEPKIPEKQSPKSSDQQSNKELALKVEKALENKFNISPMQDRGAYFCLDFRNDSNMSDNQLSYKAHGFKEQLNNALNKKYNLSIKELNL